MVSFSKLSQYEAELASNNFSPVLLFFLKNDGDITQEMIEQIIRTDESHSGSSYWFCVAYVLHILPSLRTHYSLMNRIDTGVLLELIDVTFSPPIPDSIYRIQQKGGCGYHESKINYYDNTMIV